MNRRDLSSSGPSAKRLDAYISGIPDFIPSPSEVTTLASLEPMEDRIDALIDLQVLIHHTPQ